MVEGIFIDSDKPTVRAVIAWEQAVQNPYFILDTGFTGDLVVTNDVAKDLGLEISGVTKANLAGNKGVEVPTATALAIMEGRSLYVTVFVIPEGWPLLGISFMEKFGYKAIVDCKNKKVRLEVVS